MKGGESEGERIWRERLGRGGRGYCYQDVICKRRIFLKESRSKYWNVGENNKPKACNRIMRIKLNFRISEGNWPIK